MQSLGLSSGEQLAPPPPTDALQFQRAEYAGAGPDCSFCKKAAGPSYYLVGRGVACPGCCEQLRRLQTKPERSVMLRGVLYGLGAAIAGSILFALISLTGFQFSIVAILVGYMVGKAMMRATHGRSSRACQVMAVVLTYGAITTSYLPMMISTAMKEHKAGGKKAAASDIQDAKRRPRNPGAAAAGLGVAIVFLIGFSMVLPFLMLASSPLAGLINLVIIFIGLRSAWRLTKPFGTPLLGPYTGAPADAGAAAAG
jgi:hypothetical protein